MSNLKHGHNRGSRPTPEYTCWQMMKARCQNSRHSVYGYYGGRGITVCERWQSFEHFFADMGERPSPRHSIDRIDNNGNYEPGNCRWATRAAQTLNRRNTIIATFHGKEMCLKAACALAGQPYDTVLARVKRGVSIDRALAGKRFERGLHGGN